MTDDSASVANDWPPTCSVKTFASEAPIWTVGALLSFVAASVLVTGWPVGLVPNLSCPLHYSSDTLSAAWVTQNILEGHWIFHTDRSGYPFGTDLLDYPMSDWGSFAILRVLGWLTGSYWGAMNLYFLLGFPVAFVASYFVMRAMRVSRALAAAGSLLFALLPYHFQRLHHLFLTWYFVVPIFFLFAWRLYTLKGRDVERPVNVRTAITQAATIVVSASFGIYYALFGAIVLSLGGWGGWLRSRSLRVIAATVAAVSLVAIGAIMSVTPNLIHAYTYGPNPEVAQRGLAESEIYGLKIVQMMLPRADHRIASVGDVTRRYASSAPSVNENSTATLGVVGATGLVLLGGGIWLRVSGRQVDERLAFLALIAFGIVIIATVGGLSALFATLLSPQIRGWNRASVYIAFAALAATMMALDGLLARHVPPRWHAAALATTASIVAVVGLLDQTVPACQACNRAIRAAFERDRAFMSAIESSVPEGAAIYQLPYMPFPEVPPLNHLSSYDLATGVIHSKRLRWSYATMKGRDGDLFYRALAKQPMARQVDVLHRLQFSGIYVDRRGYADGGRAVEQELRRTIGAGPSFVRSDDQVSFYKLSRGADPLPDNLGTSRILQLAGLTPDRLAPHNSSSPEMGIDFRNDTLPEFVEDIEGLAAAEPWGRWSDANLRRNVLIKFTNPLPESFTLVLRARAFGPNTGQPFEIRIGSASKTVDLSSEIEERRISFELGEGAVRKMEIVPSVPVSPVELLISDDARKLGIGLERMRFEPR
jgi:phosphoglycerol transferase